MEVGLFPSFCFSPTTLQSLIFLRWLRIYSSYPVWLKHKLSSVCISSQRPLTPLGEMVMAVTPHVLSELEFTAGQPWASCFGWATTKMNTSRPFQNCFESHIIKTNWSWNPLNYLIYMKEYWWAWGPLATRALAWWQQSGCLFPRCLDLLSSSEKRCNYFNEVRIGFVFWALSGFCVTDGCLLNVPRFLCHVLSMKL